MSSEPSHTDRTEPVVDLTAVSRAVRKHWVTTLAVALAITFGAAFWTLSQKKIYEAHATVLFDPNPPRPLGGRVEGVVEMGAGAVWDTREYYETQYQLITSSRVAVRAVQQLGLHRDAGFVQNLPPGALPKPAF